MLRIYEKDLTAANLSTALATNGLGTLPHTLSCTRHQVINGDWSLTFSYPLDAPGAALLQPERHQPLEAQHQPTRAYPGGGSPAPVL